MRLIYHPDAEAELNAAFTAKMATAKPKTNGATQ